MMADARSELAPGFLIASPPLGDPNFDRTVVLLAMHGPSGALGFVVNRVAPLGIAELLNLAGYGEQDKVDGTPVLLGGPVQPSSGWICWLDSDLECAHSGIIEVGDRVKVSSSRDAFDALAKDVPAAAAASAAARKRRMVLLGYSGWGPGQLEGEIATGAWLPVPLDAGVLFDLPNDKRWEGAYALLGLTPAVGMSMRTVGEA
jgi:putative transcriptional regulator